MAGGGVEHHGRVWVCDPLDGTGMFAAGAPLAMVSLALVEDGVPIVAAIRDPFTRRTFSAVRGDGAFCEGRRLRVCSASTLSSARVTVFGSALTQPVVSGVIRQGGDTLSTGSVVHDATLVALGAAVASVFPYRSPWDMAAVSLLVTEAGGRCTDLAGRKQRYDREVYGAVLSNGRVHDAVVALARGLWV